MGSNQSVRSSHFQRTSSDTGRPPSDDEQEHRISISNKMIERLVEDATLIDKTTVKRSPKTPKRDLKEKIHIEKLKDLDDIHSEKTGLRRLCCELRCYVTCEITLAASPFEPEHGKGKGKGKVKRSPKTPKRDLKEKIHIEKLKDLDDIHSEKTGLTIEDMSELTARIEHRTANMVNLDPVCADFKEKVIECYNKFEDPYETIQCWDTVSEFTKCVEEASGKRLKARTIREARENAVRSRHVAHAREHELRDLTTSDMNF